MVLALELNARRAVPIALVPLAHHRDGGRRKPVSIGALEDITTIRKELLR